MYAVISGCKNGNFVCMIRTLFIISFLFLPYHLFAGYPDYTDAYVNDFAGILPDASTKEMRSILSDLKAATGIEGVVVTISSVTAYNTGAHSFAAFTTGLFNYWGVGNKVRNNGFMLLLSINDRELRVELGKGYGTTYNSSMQVIIDNKIIPYLKEKEYGRALLNGVEQIINTVSAGAHSAAVREGDSEAETNTEPVRDYIPEEKAYDPQITSYHSRKTRSSGFALSPLLIFAGIALLSGGAGYLLYRLFRFRKRSCPQCRTVMILLDEKQDDKHLDKGEKAEEKLKSVDYDIWRCPSCGETKKYKFSNWFSGYRRCPKCSYITLSVTRHTITEATYTHSGRGEERCHCRHCNHRSTRNYTIAQLEHSTYNASASASSSSGSSGSSFGGGSSSGGGAGGKW